MSWSKDYKKSIDCSNPKGFSQKAHCDGRKARQRGEKTKSKSVSEMNENIKNIIIEILTEGVDDPGILKCIFMAGGPGSGKSYTAKEIFGVGKNLTASFSASGLKLVNSDTAFEKGLKDNGINPKELGKIEKEDPELWDKITGSNSIRSKAKALTQKQQSFYEAGRLGMIIDGTGDEVEKIKKKKQHAELLGYDCYMVFVNTSLEVALERNRNRDRTLSDVLVTGIWKACQDNLGKFQSIFGGNFVIVDNTVYKPINKNVQKAVDGFVRKPIYNRIGKKWIETARALKKAKLIKEGNELANTTKLYLESITANMKESVNEYLSPSDVDSKMKELGIKKIPISSQGERILKGMQKEGFLDKVTNKERLIYFYESLGKEKFGYSTKGKPLSPLVDRYWNDISSEAIFFGGKMAAWNVVTHIKDRLANREEVDSTYYMLKDYFNSFGIDTNRSRVFKSAQFHVDEWLKRNKKIASQIGESIKERINLFVEENEPTNPELWDRAIAAAKRKYDVYPSAYANAFASKWYKDKGGDWRTKKD